MYIFLSAVGKKMSHAVFAAGGSKTKLIGTVQTLLLFRKII